MVTKQESEEEDYGQLVERERQLRQQIEESKIDVEADEEETEVLGFKSYVTRMVSGEVVDVDYKDRSRSLLSSSRKNKVILHVRTDEGLYKVPVSDKGDYSEENEMVRLMEWKGISDGRIGDLIDKEVTLKLTNHPYSRNSNVSSSDLEVYIPNKFDLVGKTSFWTEYATRFAGLGTAVDILKNQDDSFLVAMLGSLALTCGAFIFMMLMIPSAVVASTLGLGWTASYLLAFLLTMSVGLVIKMAADVNRRYTNYRSRDSIRG